MIYLGVSRSDKPAIVRKYCAEHDVKRVVVIAPDRFPWGSVAGLQEDVIDYAKTIEYVVFYRLLQEIDKDSLVVLNECLRTQDRNCLTYNCIRHFLNQAGHQIVFQYLPIIAGPRDLFILFDFDTRSKWKREHDPELLREASFVVNRKELEFRPVVIEASGMLRARYESTRAKLFDELGSRDPHTIPRNLLLLSGREKAAQVGSSRWLVGRNQRLKIATMQTYRDGAFPNAPYAIFEPCHRHVDMADFVALTEQREFDYLMTDLKVERWYHERYQKWIRNVAEAYSAIQQNQERA